jgi:hypothetical protein
MGYATTDGQTPTIIGTTHLINAGAGGLAYAKTGSNTPMFRARYAHPNRDVNNSSVVGLLVQFRWNGSILSDRAGFASLGSDSGGAGNTLHTIAVDNGGQIAALAGTGGSNPGWSFSGVTVEAGRTYTVLAESRVSPSGFTLENRFWVNGRRWALETHGGSGGTLPYDWLCVLGGRRTTDLAGERHIEVLTATAFVWPATGVFALTEDQAAELSSNAYAVYEPKRIWVPLSAGPSAPVLSAATALNITTTTADLRVTVTI